MRKPTISICIPAYRQAHLLRRCLESIRSQRFRDMEVIITDDSPDDAVRMLVETFAADFPLVYSKNEPALGSPKNWNAGLAKASGRYIKTLHQDDWLRSPDALSLCVTALDENPGASFVFSACYDVRPDGTEILHEPSAAQLQRLHQEPECLLLGNFIGAPSTVTFRKDTGLLYDPHMKWVVDYDFYIRLCYKGQALYIGEPLLNIGIHEDQVTAAVQHDREVVIPEHIRLLHKLNGPIFRNIRYFDHSWRLLRNFNIRSVSDLQKVAGNLSLPPVLCIMSDFLGLLPASWVKKGMVSKSLMTLAYLRSLLSF
ncbi:glycosyltransferase family 2 protein [Chitinophaga sp. GCM10012297]|uniref:Glycosyltransferase family 2 protein n=1 Tax=Chitinophaga chungangae TaxID=2821488 RepID=A0ABS3YB24_9BACT|nr:glycosyltransferase family 2 protein [Chitinophaga chungangae]MBO9151875.1 glycosyltransferase family 2 protein [Chitinophaga chungangae]